MRKPKSAPETKRENPPDFAALESAFKSIGPKKGTIQFNGRTFECEITENNGSFAVNLSLGEFCFKYEQGKEPTIKPSQRYIEKHDFDPIAGCGEKDKLKLINRLTKALNEQWLVPKNEVITKIQDSTRNRIQEK